MGSGFEEKGSDERQEGADEATNVVRIPREWFGPRDGLVPFGPRAWEGDDPAEPGAPLDPNAFWGEEASAIHDVLEVPGGTKGRRRRAIPAGSLAASIAAVLILGACLAAWLLSSSPRRVFRPVVASVGREHGLVSAGRLGGRAAAERPSRKRLSQTPKTHARAGRSTEVAYHASSPPSGTTYAPPASVEKPAAGSSGTSAMAGASTASAANQSSQPAFGPNGALGPISSPDG